MNTDTIDTSPAARRRAKRAQQRAAILARSGGRCVMCGSTERLTLHHIRPRQIGGGYRPGNLTAICAPCHSTLHRGADLALHALCQGAAGLVVRVGRAVGRWASGGALWLLVRLALIRSPRPPGP